MTEIFEHRVEKIKAGKIERSKLSSTGRIYYSRLLTITSYESGIERRIMIQLFADQKEKLKIKEA